MTYWPISSPSVFAATKHTRLERTAVSHDDVPEQPAEQHDGPVNGSQTHVQGETCLQANGGVEEKDGATRPQQGAPGQLVEGDIHGNIIAARVTRSGHMFATLTRSTLTIWQTKACLQLRQLLLR